MHLWNWSRRQINNKAQFNKTVMFSLSKFKDFFRYYQGQEHQEEAIELLFECLPAELKDDSHPWIRKYRNETLSVIIEPEPQPTEPEVPEYVTLGDLAYIWNCSPSLIKDWEVEELNECLDRFGITTPQRIRHFLSQTAHESGGGKWMKELSDGWYLEGRSDLGNVHPGDGPKYKGAGYLQLTGRSNYRDLADFTGDERVMEGVEYVSTTYPFTSAGVWWYNNNMNFLIDNGGTVEEVTRRVNGGYNGLDDRKYYYNRCLQVI